MDNYRDAQGICISADLVVRAFNAMHAQKLRDKTEMVVFSGKDGKIYFVDQHNNKIGVKFY